MRINIKQLASIAVIVTLSVTITGIVRSPNDSIAAPGTLAGYQALGERRIIDTRTGDKVPSSSPITVYPGWPEATAVGVNIASTQGTGAGFVSAYSSRPWPGTASLNTSGPNQDISNFVIVPIHRGTENMGSFQLLTSTPSHVVVDLTGLFADPSFTPPPGRGFSSLITGYLPDTNLNETRVFGVAVQGFVAGPELLRLEVSCPDGDLATVQALLLDGFETEVFEVRCDGAHTSGATVGVKS